MCDDSANMGDKKMKATSCIQPHTLDHCIDKTDGGEDPISSNVGTKRTNISVALLMI